MPASFDWEFEDEERPSRPAGDSKSSAGRRRWLRWAAVLIGIFAIIGLGFRVWTTARQRVVGEAEAQLRAAVELELRAIAERDVELFRGRQDPDDKTWVDRQLVRYLSPSAERFTPAPGLGRAERPPEIDELTLDGRSGRVALVFWFHEGPERGGELPFSLNWYYDQDKDGDWYHVAPPRSEPRLPNPGDHPALAISATQAEADLLAPIATELGDLVDRSCEWLGCPDEVVYRLVFADVPEPQVRGDRWMLPTLALAGRPSGEDSRAAWKRALGRWVVEALARTVVRDQTLTQRFVFRPLVARLAGVVGLRQPSSRNVALLAQALAEGRQHLPDEIWYAERQAMSHDAEVTRLLDEEAAALVDLLEARFGTERLLQLLPGELQRGDRAGAFPIQNLDGEGLAADWFAYLTQLTGQQIAPFSTFHRVPPVAEPLQSPHQLPPLADSVASVEDGQLALVCDGRVWLGDADAASFIPLTARGERFADPRWSPDGRWLVVRWLHTPGEAYSALYLLAADGSEARLLTDDQAADVSSVAFDPSGRFVIYEVASETRAIDLQTGVVRRLPGAAIWSPDGERLAYVAGSPLRTWLADADWNNPHLVAYPGLPRGERTVWSPMGAKLALTRNPGYPYDSSIVVYDADTQEQTGRITVYDLLKALIASDDAYVSNTSERLGLEARSLTSVWPLGWSADGRHLLVGGEWTRGTLTLVRMSVLAAVPVDGSVGRTQGLAEERAPRVVAYGKDMFPRDAVWSPTDPTRMIFKWRVEGEPDILYETTLFDLRDGPLYSAPDIAQAIWSPDGAWVAFLRPDALILVGRDGQEHLTTPLPGSCTDLAWNPA